MDIMMCWIWGIDHATIARVGSEFWLCKDEHILHSRCYFSHLHTVFVTCIILTVAFIIEGIEPSALGEQFAKTKRGESQVKFGITLKIW